jgi:hypothetical protein
MVSKDSLMAPGEVRPMSWMTYYVEVSTRQREDEIAHRIARQRQLKRLARAPRRHWWSLRRSAPVTRTQTVRGEVACRRAASLSSARSS